MFDAVKGQAFVDSYGRASTANDPVAIPSHYAEPFTSFTLGHIGGFANQAEARARMVPWMKRFQEYGLGAMHLADSELVPVSDNFCLCHLTFEIRPTDGKPPFRFTNVYGLRQDEKGQRFEFAVSDNEVSELVARYPAFMEGQG